MEILLRKLAIEQRGKITRINGMGQIVRRMRDMGIVPGTEIKVIGRAPLYDPVAIKIRDTVLTLRNNEADHIYVDVSLAPIKVAIAGNPNSGKTSIFNLLAKTNYHVGNYPGVTVEKKEASMTYCGQAITLVDLPGTYSLSAYSIEEIIARNYVINENPDLIIHVVDASNLERNLYLVTQFLELNTPLIIALNMVDVAEKRDIRIDTHALSKALGVKVVKTIAREGKGREDLLKTITETICKGAENKQTVPININYGNDIAPLLNEMETLICENFFLPEYPSRWTAIKYLENDKEIIKKGSSSKELHDRLCSITRGLEEHLKNTLNTYPEALIADYRYGFLSAILKGIVTRKKKAIDRVFLSDKIDNVLTARPGGPLIMLLVLYAVYEFTFFVSEYPIFLIQSFFDLLSQLAGTILGDGPVGSLVSSGIISGSGAVLGFTPLIFLMFFTIAILEDSGYMARIAYMLDRVFKFFGLQGSSAISYIVSGGIGGGCAVPGIMATRTIRGTRERLLTIMTAPFMMCGAKIPVFVLLIGTFYAGSRGLFMLLINLVSWLAALSMAKILGKTVVRGESSEFVMELPPYRLPTLKGLSLHAWERTWMYIKKAGTIILGISILFWALMTFPGLPAPERELFEKELSNLKSKYSSEVMLQAQSKNESISKEALKARREITALSGRKAMAGLKHSLAGQLGTALVPVSHYAGFDWRTNIALIGGLAAREVVVSTLGTAYSMGEVDPEKSGSLIERLKADPKWNPAIALALIVFTILYSPCFATLIVIVRETGKLKWGVISLVGYTFIAFISSVIVYQVF